MIGFLIICAFIGLFLAFIMAPMIIVQDKKNLKQIDKKIEEFEGKSFSSQEEKEREKQLLKKELIKIKAKIFAKNLKEEAGDKISIL